MVVKRTFGILLLAVGLTMGGCGKKDGGGGGINIFSVQDDKDLGEELAAEIRSRPQEFPLLSRQQYPEAYAHLDRIFNYVLASPRINYREEFDWEIHIVHDDQTLNAFAGPGGKLYFYTGLIKYLEDEAAFAGVMAHEIAHSDRRHVTDQLTRIYGLTVLLEVVLGQNRTVLADIAANLAVLSFSRSHERQADEYSVYYLCRDEVDVDARGAARFFEKLIDEGHAGGTPEFLSTHPNPGNRVEDIHQVWEDHCNEADPLQDQRYQQFKNSLP